MFGGTHPGVWSGHHYTVPSDGRLPRVLAVPRAGHQLRHGHLGLRQPEHLAVGDGVNNLPYSTSHRPRRHPGLVHQAAPEPAVPDQARDGESETTSGSGGSVSTASPSPVPSGVLQYPAKGVIYVNDNVWIEGTNVDGRITIAGPAS